MEDRSAAGTSGTQAAGGVGPRRLDRDLSSFRKGGTIPRIAPLSFHLEVLWKSPENLRTGTPRRARRRCCQLASAATKCYGCAEFTRYAVVHNTNEATTPGGITRHGRSENDAAQDALRIARALREGRRRSNQ